MKTYFTLLLLIFSLSAQASDTDNGVHEFLDGFVANYSKSSIDFFYVSPPHEGIPRKCVYIYWMTGNCILIVDIPTERQEDYSWYGYKARIRLESGVVPTQEDIDGSTFLVDSDWVETRLKECPY